LKKVIYLITAVITLLLIILSCSYWNSIVDNFETKPGDYLIQLLCMLIPILISLFLFHVESLERKDDLILQEQRLDKQEENQKQMQETFVEITNILDAQNTKQEKMGESLEKTALELRRIRLPKGLEFLYENIVRIEEYIQSDSRVQNTMNVVARHCAMGELLEKWREVELEEVPLKIRREFENTRYFFENYSKLLFISYNFLVSQEKDLEKKNIFAIGFNASIRIVDMIAMASEKLNSLPDDNRKDISREDSQLLSIYYNDSKEKTVEVLEKRIEIFHSNLFKMKEML
jgi:uncharacterized protein YxeA